MPPFPVRRRSETHRGRPDPASSHTFPSPTRTSPGFGPADPYETRISSASRSTARQSETTAITIAFRGPTFMNVCRISRGSRRTATISSSGRSAFCFGPVRKRDDRNHAHPSRGRRDHHLRLVDEQRRQGVARGRSGAQISAQRAAIPDLRRAHRSRRFGQSRQHRCDPVPHRLRVREARSEPKRAVVPPPAAQLGDLVQVQDRLGPGAVEVQFDHDVGPALDRNRVLSLGLQRQRLVERLRGEHLHAPSLRDRVSRRFLSKVKRGGEPPKAGWNQVASALDTAKRR